MELTDSFSGKLGQPARPVIENMATLNVEEGVLKRFQYDCFRKGIKPVALIDYYRRPYISKYDSEFRVTLDERLYATETTELFPGKTAIRRPVKQGYTIMEVKFNRHIPAWFHRIIQSYELRRLSISKICEGMQALGMASEHA